MNECYGGGPDCEYKIRWSIENHAMNPGERLQYSCSHHLTEACSRLLAAGYNSHHGVLSVTKWGIW